MKIFFLALVILAVVIGSFFFLTGIFSANGAPQEAAIAGMEQSNVSNPEIRSLEKDQILFTGTSIPTNNPEKKGTTIKLPNGKTLVIESLVEWYDKATDWRITGKSFWYSNSLTEEDGLQAKVWGKGEIFVDGEKPHDETRGKWELSWFGRIIPKEDPPYNEKSPFTIMVEAVGIGIEGEVKGLVAKWTYTFDSDLGYFYSKGFIQEKD